MSKDANIYKNVNGTEAYLAGIVEGNTENCLEFAFHNKLTSSGYSVCIVSDVYSLGENNELTIQQAIKKRMEEKCFDLFFDKGDVAEEIIDKMISDLKITEIESDPNTVITGLVKSAANDVEVIREDIERYTGTLEWYFGKPKSIYEVEDNSQLFKAYLYILFKIIMIEYDQYIVMLGVGTDD